MYKSCSRCGRVHDINYKCNVGRKPIDWKKYNRKREYYKLINTDEWHKKSEEIRKASRYLCAVCEDEGRYNYKDVEVHHIYKLIEKPELKLNNYNLICLCKEHHKLADNDFIDKSYLLELAKKREEMRTNPPN